MAYANPAAEKEQPSMKFIKQWLSYKIRDDVLIIENTLGSVESTYPASSAPGPSR